jgi:outer membrane protein
LPKVSTLILLLFFALLGIKAVGQSVTINLEEAWQKAAQNAPVLRERQLSQQIAKTQIALAERQRLPAVNGQYTNSLNLGRSIDPFTNQFLTQTILGNNYGVSANYILFNGGQIAGQISRSKQLSTLAGYNTAVATNEVMLQTLVAYAELLLATEQRQLIATQQRATAENLTYFQKLYDADRIRLLALERLRAELQSFAGQLASVNGNMLQAQRRLGRLVGVAVGQEVSAKPFTVAEKLATLDVSVEDIYKATIRHLPQVRAFQLQSQIKQTELRINNAQRLPEISAISNLGTTYSSAARRVENNELVKINYPRQFFDNLNTAVGVSVRFPIFNTVNYRLNGQVIRTEQQLINAQLETQKLEIRALVEDAFSSYESIMGQYTALQQRTETLNKIYTMSTLGFKEGRVELIDYLQSKREYEEAQQQRTRLQYEFILQKKILYFYQSGTWQ